MKSPYNPRVLLWNNDGRPSPRAKIFFFERDTDVPKSVKYVESGTLTNEITADSSGDFPQVELLYGEYTLKGYVPLDPKEPYPEFPLDYELRDTWDLSGEEVDDGEETETPATVEDLQALREYDGDAEKVWVGNRLFDKDVLISQTDNNGTIVVSSALTDVVWRMDLTGYDMTSLDWFGADRTGATDSTAAFISAISAIYDNDANSAPYKLPRTLYIPEGVYMINSDINFTCPVFMEKSVRFGNTSVVPVTLTFSSALETLKTNKFDLNLPGLSKINLRFPNGGHVNLGWFTDDTIDMAEHPYKIDITGPGKVELFGGETRRIGKLDTNGLLTFEGGVGSKLLIDEITSGPANIVVSGAWDPSAITVPEFDLSSLADPLKIIYITGNTLAIDRNWDISYGFTSSWSRVVGKLVNGAKPVLNNTSGLVGRISFPNADVEWDSLDCSVHDLVWENGPVAKYLDWAGTDGSDWTAQLAYSLADFTGTTTSGDIAITSDATIKGLNHTGSFLGTGSLTLEDSKISVSSGDNVGAPIFKLLNSEVVNDSPSNGTLYSGDMRLVNSYITCPVYLTSNGYMQLEMRGCRFTNQITVNQSGTLQTLVARNNEVAKADFIPYHFTITDFPNDAGISIDVSDNWTTDLSGQLVRTKGHAIVPGSGAGKVAIESFGFLDMIRPSGLSWAVWGPGETYGPFIGKKYIVGTPEPVLQSENGSATLENQSVNETQIYATFWSTQNWRSTGV